MKEQVERLRQRGVAAEQLDSTRSAAEAGAVSAAVRAGKLRLLFVAPERLNNERFRGLLQGVRVSLFAVDEAHCISEWGHNFRPDYLKLARYARACRAERTLALTATATPQVLADVCAGFGIDPGCAVRTGFYRPNLTLLLTPTEASGRDAELLQRLQSSAPGAAIVYVTLQRTAEEVAGRLAAAGVPARAYHAGVDAAERAAVQDWFAQSGHAVVVATIAFGMGIDKADIRAVYHYNLPKSLENLAQEIGRAGRDGLPARCETFVCPEDLNALENFAYGDTPSLQAVTGLVNEVFRQGPEFDLSLYDLGGTHDLRPTVLATLLTYLELDGYLESGTPFFSRYQFRPLKTSAEILARFQGERRTFLAQVFRQATNARVWFTLDVEQAARATASPRERVVSALEYLDEQGLLEVKVDGVRHRFRRLRQPESQGLLAADLHGRTLERERREIDRLRQVLDLAGHDGCQVARLGEHFGQALAGPCGYCTWCLAGRKPTAIPPRPALPIPAEVWEKARALRSQRPELFGDARTLARLLCGLTSPRLSREKLGSHSLFGALQDVPFAEVLVRAAGN
jgi:ATP-dependent DNA helicase RecQ